MNGCLEHLAKNQSKLQPDRKQYPRACCNNGSAIVGQTTDDPKELQGQPYFGFSLQSSKMAYRTGMPMQRPQIQGRRIQQTFLLKLRPVIPTFAASCTICATILFRSGPHSLHNQAPLFGTVIDFKSRSPGIWILIVSSTRSSKAICT